MALPRTCRPFFPRIGVLLIGLCIGGLGGCCVAPPLTQEWLAVGFRDPEQTIHTFQTAVRADAPDLEYRCFSTEFRRRNGISKLTWREAREELRRRYPWLRLGLADAQIEGEITLVGNRAEALLVTHGEHIRIGLVREDFAELWSGNELLSDDPDVVFERQTTTQEGPDGSRWFYGWAHVSVVDPTLGDVTDVHVGREWKIDAFENAEAQEEDNRGQPSPLQEAH